MDNKKIVKNSFWRLTEVFSGELLSLLLFLVITAFVQPDAFGTIAIATAIIGLSVDVLNNGFADRYIQSQDNSSDLWTTFFWSNILLGVFLACFVSLMSFPISWITGSPELLCVIPVLALSLPIMGFSGIISGKLRREMRFKSFAIRSTVAISVSGCVALLMAINGYEIWALVAQQLTNAVVTGIVFFYVERRIPAPSISFKLLRENLIFVRQVTLIALINSSGKKLDVLLIGIFQPAAAVGLYFLASRINRAIEMVTAHSINAILLPVFAQATNISRGQILLESCRWVGILCWPIAVGLFLVSHLVMDVLLSEKWQDANQPLAYMALFSVLLSLRSVFRQFLLSNDLSGLCLRLTAVSTVMFLSAIGIGSLFGLNVAIIAGGLASLLALLLWLISSVKYTSAETIPVIRTQVPTVISVILMGFSVQLCIYILSPHIATLAVLLCSIAIGSLVYCVAIVALSKNVRMIIKRYKQR